MKECECIVYNKKKLIDEPVLLNKLILKSPIIQLVLFSLAMLWRICWMFSKKFLRVLMSGHLYIIPIIVFFRLVSST